MSMSYHQTVICYELIHPMTSRTNGSYAFPKRQKIVLGCQYLNLLIVLWLSNLRKLTN